MPIRTLLLAKFVRTFVYSTLAILLGVYLVARGLTLVEAGVVFSAAVAGNTISTLGAPHLFRWFGIRRTSVFAPFLVSASGMLFLFGHSFVDFVLAALIGSVSVTQTEAGGYLVIDQTLMPEFAGQRGVTGAFSTYNLTGYLGSSAGGAATLVAGRVLPEGTAFTALMAVYALSGFFLSALYYTLPTQSLERRFSASSNVYTVTKTNPLIVRLSSLFALDAFAGGLTTQSWVSYWFSYTYSVPLPTLGLIFLVSNSLSAFSLTLAPPLVRKLGLVRVMVFTHLPSNFLLMLVPFAGSAAASAAVFFARQTLSQMDVPTRQALVVSLVNERDRAGASGVTTAVRGLAQTLSSPLTGRLLSMTLYTTPFLMSGGLKAAYDLAILYTMRRKLDLGMERKEL